MQVEANIGPGSREDALRSFKDHISRAKQTALIDEHLSDERRRQAGQVVEKVEHFIGNPGSWLKPLALGMTGLASVFAGTHIVDHIYDNRAQTVDIRQQVPASDPEIIKTSLSNPPEAEYPEEQESFFPAQTQGVYPTGKEIPPNYEIIGVGELSKRGWRGEGVRVYVLDTGVGPEIAQIYGLDEDGGYDAINDLPCDGEDNIGNCDDLYGKRTGRPHGGGVDAIIKSIVPDAEVKTVRMINGAGESSIPQLRRAIDYVVEDSRGYDGQVVVNTSFGSDEFDPEDFSNLNDPKIIFITAHGNMPLGARLPATLPWTTIDVGSVDVDCYKNGEVGIYRHWSSAHSREIEGMAPGGGNCLFIATPDGTPLRDKDGNFIVVRATSGAAPHITGLAAAFAGAGYQEGYTVTREEMREFFTHIQSRQLVPGEEYESIDWLTRNGYFNIKDVAGTPNQITGYGLITAKAAGEWLRYLKEGGKLGEVNITILPNAESGNNNNTLESDEWIMGTVNLRNSIINNSVPKLFTIGESFPVYWLNGQSMLGFEIEGHTNSLGTHPINIINGETITETAVIDALQLPRTTIPIFPQK
jgi:hypothetical protein